MNCRRFVRALPLTLLLAACVGIGLLLGSTASTANVTPAGGCVGIALLLGSTASTATPAGCGAV